MILDKKSPIPVYYQLKNIIQEKIKNGEYGEGELIPSERELSEAFGISRMTVRQALSQMESEGLIVRQKGRGTFVAGHKIVQNNIKSFSESVRDRGLVPSTRVLYFKKERVSEDIAGILNFSGDELFYIIKRLRCANDIPVGLEEVFIPAQFCPGLEKFSLDASLYQLINDQYGISIVFMDHIIEASAASAEEKRLLGIGSNIPVLKVSGICYISGDRKFSYERDVYRGDQFSFNARIHLN